MRVRLSLCACLLALAPARAGAQELVLLYNRHAAYHELAADGSVDGLIAAPLAAALRRAQVPFRWREAPVARQRSILHENQETVCVVGALKTAERAQAGKFTEPLYRALPVVALSLASNRRMVGQRPLRQTLDDPRLTLLAKDGYTFGPYVTEAIAASGARVMRTQTEIPNMVAMLLHGRADYFFMAEDAFAPLILKSGYRLGQFKITRFSDMPPGNERYLWCSARVPDGLIARINHEFEKLARPRQASR
ncbi:MAG: transporter substrate-binding domain-containing protein [Pseudomonadota bacterium]